MRSFMHIIKKLLAIVLMLNLVNGGYFDAYAAQRRSTATRKRVPTRRAAPRSSSGRIAVPPAPGRVNLSAKSAQPTLTIVTKMRATVFDGGIFVGVSNQAIPLDPGNHQIMVTAEGYLDAKHAFQLKPGMHLRVPVTLRKPAPAPKPQPRAEPRAARQKVPTIRQQSSRKSSGLDYTSDLPTPKGVSRLPSGAKRNVPSTPSRDAGKDFLRELKGQAPAQPAYPQQPGYAQQPQNPYAQPPTAYPPAYPQAYPQPYAPPAYAAPMYPPMYVPQPVPVPVPVYPPVYQQPQYAPPQPYAPQGNSDGDYDDEDSDEPEAPKPNYASPSGAGSPHMSGSASRSSSRSKGGNGFVAVLPFGVGQFQNRQYGKGMLFALGEVGALGAGIYFYVYANKLTNELINSNLDTSKADVLDYYTKQAAFIKTQRTISYACLGGAGVIWVIGIVDALINLNSGHVSRRNADLEKPWDVKVGVAKSSPFGLGVETHF